MLPSVLRQSGVGEASQRSTATKGDTVAAQEFSSAMSSNAQNDRPSASGAPASGTGPQTSETTRPGPSFTNVQDRSGTLYQSYVSRRANRLPSFIPQTVRTATATVQTRLTGGFTKSNVEAKAIRDSNRRLAAAPPAPAQAPGDVSRAEEIDARKHRTSVMAIDQGMPADEAIATYGVQKPRDQVALRQYEQGDISRNNALTGNVRDPKDIPGQNPPATSTSSSESLSQQVLEDSGFANPLRRR